LIVLFTGPPLVTIAEDMTPRSGRKSVHTQMPLMESRPMFNLPPQIIQHPRQMFLPIRRPIRAEDNTITPDFKLYDFCLKLFSYQSVG
jgi:hypothetical protein